jgi:Flp pilus assembly protein TadD
MRFGNRSILLAALCVIALVFIAFGASLTQDFSPIDDSFLIINNAAAHGITWDHLKTVFTSYDPELYIPFTFVSFQLNYILSGLSAWSYHLTNLLLHSANALLVGWLLLLLTSRRGVAIAVALIFAVHSLHTEAVVWIAGRKDLLATLFFLLSFITYLKSHERGWKIFMLSLLFFLCALLSKAVVITLPIVLILSDLLIERRSIDRRMILEKVPYILLSGVFFVIALGGKERVLASSSLWETGLMAAKSSIFYLEKLFVPLHLSVFYPFDGTITITAPEFFIPIILVIALLGIAFWAFRRAPWISFGILFYFITLGPTFFNFHKGSQMFFGVDRYAYIPSIGFLIVVTLIGSDLLDRWTRHASSLAKNIAVTIVVLIFSVLSMLQTMTWNSPETLYIHAMELYPASPFTRANVSMLYRTEGNFQKAFSILKEGLQYGDSPMLRMEAGLTYSAAGQVDDARTQFEAVMEEEPENPDAVYYLGFLDEHDGNIDGAIAYYEKAVAQDPSYVVARTALGNLLLQKGNRDGAQEQYEESIQWNPNATDAYIGLAVILSLKGDSEGAKVEIDAAKALDTSAEQRFETLKSRVTLAPAF